MKIGTNVTIKLNLIPNQIYGGAIFVPEMEEFCGRSAVITEILFPVVNEGESKFSYGLGIDMNKEFEFTSEMLDVLELNRVA